MDIGESEDALEAWYLRNDQVAVIERGVMELDEHVVVAERGNLGRLGELQVIEA